MRGGVSLISLETQQLQKMNQGDGADGSAATGAPQLQVQRQNTGQSPDRMDENSLHLDLDKGEKNDKNVGGRADTGEVDYFGEEQQQAAAQLERQFSVEQ